MNIKQVQATVEFASDILAFGDITLSGIADRDLASRFGVAHIRAGKFSPVWGTNRAFHGSPVLAVAHDPIDDVAFILTADGRRLSV